jgi:hypothetical protein
VGFEPPFVGLQADYEQTALFPGIIGDLSNAIATALVTYIEANAVAHVTSNAYGSGIPSSTVNTPIT